MKIIDDKERKNQRKVGASYEDLAAEYLMKQGYLILERNYRNRFGEIDLIAKKPSDDDKSKPVIVYVEVKYRKTKKCGDPLEAVTLKKQRTISKVAMYHYAYHGYEACMPCRFDVIAIYGDGQMTHIKNAFSYIG